MTLDRFITVTPCKKTEASFLSDKYKAVNLSQWLDNKSQINKINEAMVSKRHIVISGKSGTGKTSLIQLLSSFNNKTVYELQTNIKRTLKNISDYFCTMKADTKNSLFVIDDFEFFFNNVETINVKDLITMLYKEEIQCVFIINDIYVSKLVSALTKRKFDQIFLTRPNQHILYDFCKAICVEEQIKYDQKSLEQYIIMNDCDVRFVVNTLPHYLHFDTLPKFHEVGMYEAFQNVIGSDYSFVDRLLFFQLEPGTIPVIAHENILDIKLGYEKTYNTLHNMSLADCFHKRTFPHLNQNESDTYAVLSSLCLHQFKPKIQNPRFGLIWTKQAAKFQKKKYLNEFVSKTHYGPTSYTELSYLFYILNHSVYNNNEMIWTFMQCLNIDNKSMFNLYNGYTLRDEKLVTRKFFTDLKTTSFGQS
jgi:hypothetical protein